MSACDPALVYLHIPRSGGTSQRRLFYHVYGEESVYWHGRDSGMPNEHYERLEGREPLLIGGHRRISYYPAGLDALYVSAVREPFKRVASLYSHYARPHESDSGHPNARARAYSHGQAMGVDPESLVNTINQSKQFRNMIHNAQCRYLSRRKATFADAIETIETHPCIVGDERQSAGINSQLAQLFGWRDLPSYRVHGSRKGSVEATLEEPGARDLVQDLVEEDIALYTEISNRYDGLFTNLSLSDQIRERLRI